MSNDFHVINLEWASQELQEVSLCVGVVAVGDHPVRLRNRAMSDVSENKGTQFRWGETVLDFDAAP